MEMWKYTAQLKKRSLYPGLTHEHIPNKKVYVYGVEIQTNSYGFRANREYILPKPKNTKRILVLGDSIAMGWGVRLENTYPYILESLLNKKSSINFDVINTSVGNYNSLSELMVLKRFIDFDPDVIILNFYINDLEYIQFLPRINYFINRYSYLYAFIWNKIIKIKYRLGGDDYRAYYLKLYRNQKLRLQAKNAIEQIIGIANNYSIPLILVNIPEMHNFKEYIFVGAQQFIEDIAQKHPQIIFIDFLKILSNKEARNFWVSSEDPHPNANLHKIIAEAVYYELQNKIIK